MIYHQLHLAPKKKRTVWNPHSVTSDFLISLEAVIMEISYRSGTSKSPVLMIFSMKSTI